MKSPLNVSFKISNPSSTGLGKKYNATSASLARWSNKQAYDKLREARGTLRSAAAYARKVMRSGFKRGSTKTVRKKSPAVGIPAATMSRKKRKPSPAGSPPRYWTKGKQWGIKTIVFTKLDQYGDSYSIGAKRFTSKQAKFSRFNIPEMLEFGGTGQVKVFANRDKVKEVKSLWSNITKSGGKVPNVWKSARYRPRPYSSIVLKPTLQKFHSIYGR